MMIGNAKPSAASSRTPTLPMNQASTKVCGHVDQVLANGTLRKPGFSFSHNRSG